MEPASPSPSEPHPSASDLPLDASSPERALTLRDDRLPFAGFLEAAEDCRRRGAHLRIIDSGALKISELEWLGEAGAGLYTSDHSRRDLAEFILMVKAARRGGAVAAYFHNGPLDEVEKPNAVPFAGLREMGRSGMDLHLSNKNQPRDPALLSVLADDGRAGGAVFVYYHHGAFVPALEDLSRQGAWIHGSCADLSGPEDDRLFRDCVIAARKAGSNLALHIEKRPDPQRLERIFEAGAILIFRTPPSDYRSPLRPLEEAAAKRAIPPRAVYLFADFVL